MNSRRTRARRVRRQLKQLLAHGPSAKPSHRARGGRTGQVFFRALAAVADGGARATEKRVSHTVTRIEAPVARVGKLGGFMNLTPALALLLSLSLASPSWAAEDAPTAAPGASGAVLLPVATAPVEPLCLSPAEQVALAKRLEADKARIASLTAAPAPLPPLAVVGLVVLGVVAGGAAGYGIAVATRPAAAP